MSIKKVGIVRKRGQLTIPDEIRKKFSWLKPASAVTIIAQESKLVIARKREKSVNWELVWNSIRLARTFKGSRGNLSEFIVQDRDRH